MADFLWLDPTGAPDAASVLPLSLSNDTASSVTVRFFNGLVMDIATNQYCVTPTGRVLAETLLPGSRVGFELAALTTGGRTENVRHIFYEVSSVEARSAERSWLLASASPVLYAQDLYAAHPCTQLSLSVTII